MDNLDLDVNHYYENNYNEDDILTSSNHKQRRTKRANILRQKLLPQLATNYSVGIKKYRLLHKQADVSDLTTFVKLQDKNSVLHVTGLENRLIISLPEQLHDLRTTRFFLLVKSNNQSEAFGYVYFRQDQLHIDLFVFFSVFFSCFFLFLAGCIMLWKVKHLAERRRAIQRHEVELQHLARRPFARATVDLSARATTAGTAAAGEAACFQAYNTTTTNQAINTNKRRSKFLQQHQNNTVRDSSSPIRTCDLISVRPMAIEPLNQGKIAVATILIHMPQYSVNQSLMFGSVLIKEPSD